MKETRARACVLIILLSIQIIIAKPFFGLGLWCGLLCMDDDYGDDSSYFDPCEGCDRGPKQPTAPPAPTATMSPVGTMGGSPNQMSIVIPPSNGVNLTMLKVGDGFYVQMNPWSAMSASPAQTTKAPAAPATTAATTAAAASTTAAAATTSAATEATTAAAARK